MFFTIQFPFIDVRDFLREPIKIVPKRHSSGIINFESIIRERAFVRHMGPYKLRHLQPFMPATEKSGSTIKKTFKSKIRPEKRSIEDGKWGLFSNIFDDEYLYAKTRRGLRLVKLEKQKLLGGKLCKPRAKVRALHISPFLPDHATWSPGIRIELGILYDVPTPLDGTDLEKAIREFMNIEVEVPVYERDSNGNKARELKEGKDCVKPHKLHKDKLISQIDALSKLIIDSTSAQYEAIHDKMIKAGEPLITVHYSKNEITSLPSAIISLPKTNKPAALRDNEISFYSIKPNKELDYPISAWLFELPDPQMKNDRFAKIKDALRNTNIAIMRYWSEIQAKIVLYDLIAEQDFGFVMKEKGLLAKYQERTNRIHTDDKWGGAPMGLIREIILAHQPYSKKMIDILNDFKSQFAKSQRKIKEQIPSIFVSYSHKDVDFLPPIKSALNFIEGVEYFDDLQISSGEAWEHRIMDQLERASVGVLLISNNFFDSDFIMKTELPKIIDRCLRKNLIIISVVVDGNTAWKSEFLKKYQLPNMNNPLSDCYKNEEEKKRLMDKLKEEVVKAKIFLTQ